MSTSEVVELQDVPSGLSLFSGSGLGLGRKRARAPLVPQHDSFNDTKTATAGVVAITYQLKYAKLPGNVRLCFETGRLLLADDMGLGKTTQAIAACHGLFETACIERGLLIVPAALKPQWKREWEATTRVPIALVEGPLGRRGAAHRGARRARGTAGRLA